ncbi:sigma-70 family RNA polymerase sigma factor [bacterium SCSIO 12741]|nr:sigma-70 family RNA polymerase sigma factor [bacterium SCSIO 12741]
MVTGRARYTFGLESVTALTESELIEALRAKSEIALRQLIQDYSDRVYNVVLNLVQNKEDAEELYSDVFLEVFQSISKFRDGSSLYTWVYRIAVNKSLDHLRKKKRKKRLASIFSLSFLQEERGLEPAHFDHPGVLLEQKENAALFYAALNQLPERQKAAYVLRHIEGRSQPEIAEILETSVSSVESLLSRSKAGLKKIVSNHFHFSEGNRKNKRPNNK